MITIVGIGHGAISAAGRDKLLVSHSVVLTGEFARAELEPLCPKANFLQLKTRGAFLERRENYYACAAEEILAIAQQHGELVVPVAGNPFFLEGIASALRASAPQPVVCHAAPSVVDALFEHFPRLVAGGGYRVVDTSESLFSCRLDPGCDLVLVQLARAGSKRQTFDSTPSVAWLTGVFDYLAAVYPDRTGVSSVEIGSGGAKIVSTSLGQVRKDGLRVTPFSTVVVLSPWKPAPDSEAELLSRLTSPIDRYLSA